MTATCATYSFLASLSPRRVVMMGGRAITGAGEGLGAERINPAVARMVIGDRVRWNEYDDVVCNGS